MYDELKDAALQLEIVRTGKRLEQATVFESLAKTPLGEQIVASLEDRKKQIQGAYCAIDPSSSVFVAQYSRMCGAEDEIRQLVDMIKYPEREKKRLDIILKMCINEARKRQTARESKSGGTSIMSGKIKGDK